MLVLTGTDICPENNEVIWTCSEKSRNRIKNARYVGRYAYGNSGKFYQHVYEEDNGDELCLVIRYK